MNGGVPWYGKVGHKFRDMYALLQDNSDAALPESIRRLLSLSEDALQRRLAGVNESGMSHMTAADFLDLEKVLRYKLSVAIGDVKKYNANENHDIKRQVDVTVKYLIRLFIKQKGRCAVTRIPFFKRGPNGTIFTPSIDRLITTLGYEEGNLQLVIEEVNVRSPHIADYWPEILAGIVETQQLQLTSRL
jgi:hypothetical protein